LGRIPHEFCRKRWAKGGGGGPGSWEDGGKNERKKKAQGGGGGDRAGSPGGACLPFRKKTTGLSTRGRDFSFNWPQGGATRKGFVFFFFLLFFGGGENGGTWPAFRAGLWKEGAEFLPPVFFSTWIWFFPGSGGPRGHCHGRVFGRGPPQGRVVHFLPLCAFHPLFRPS